MSSEIEEAARRMEEGLQVLLTEWAKPLTFPGISGPLAYAGRDWFDAPKHRVRCLVGRHRAETWIIDTRDNTVTERCSCGATRLNGRMWMCD